MLTNKCSLVSHLGWWVGFEVEVPGQFWLKYWALDLTADVVRRESPCQHCLVRGKIWPR